MSMPLQRGYSQDMRAYLSAIALTPLLTYAEEQALARRIAEGDAQARDHLIRANLRLVASIAHGFLNRGPEFEDLVSEGCLGLIRATQTFDPKLGVRFGTYAGYWIRQSMRIHVIEVGRFLRLPSYVVTLLARSKRTSAELQRQIGRLPTTDELGRALGLSKFKLGILRGAILTDYLTHHREVLGESEDGQAREFNPPDTRIEAVEDVMDWEEDLSAVLEAVDHLDGFSATVLRLRYGLDSDKPWSYKLIGKRLGLTNRRVHQFELKTLAQLFARLSVADTRSHGTLTMANCS